MDTVCVTLATYNGHKYIEEQLKSLLSQTRKPDFIVISDGMSSDATVEVCSGVLRNSGVEYEILTSDRRLSVIDNFQKALRNAKGDYIFFCDQDDVWLPTKIEITLKQMKKYGASMAFCNAQLVDSTLKPMKKKLWSSVGYRQSERIRVIEPCAEDFITELIKRNVVTGMCMCVANETVGKLLPFSKNTLHDTWMAFVIASMYKTVAINEQLVLYRQHSYNAVGAAKGIKKTISNASKYLGYIKSRKAAFIEILAKFGATYSNELFVYLKGYTEHLDFRINYMSGSDSFVSPLFKLKGYRQYELTYFSIILKDMLMHCKSFLQRG